MGGVFISEYLYEEETSCDSRVNAEDKKFIRKTPIGKNVIVIAGATSVGKTALSLLVANKLGGEIVSADSAQVYIGMDVGTAKIKPHEMQDIPHHLIDIITVRESFNVVDFFYEARQSCISIISRNKVPIIVGGSGFYLGVLFDGPPSGPPSDPEIRGIIEAELDNLGIQYMFELLKEYDPDYAETITCNDKHKIVRAFEIIALTGKKVSEHKRSVSHGSLIPFKYHKWLLTLPRETLYKNINTRCDKMMQDGLLEEVVSLDASGIRENRSAASAIGYKQWLEFLDSDRSSDSYLFFLDLFKKKTRQFAKRQNTWFNKSSDFNVVDVSETSIEEIADRIVCEYLSEI